MCSNVIPVTKKASKSCYDPRTHSCGRGVGPVSGGIGKLSSGIGYSKNMEKHVGSWDGECRRASLMARFRATEGAWQAEYVCNCGRVTRTATKGDMRQLCGIRFRQSPDPMSWLRWGRLTDRPKIRTFEFFGSLGQVVSKCISYAHTSMASVAGKVCCTAVIVFTLYCFSFASSERHQTCVRGLTEYAGHMKPRCGGNIATLEAWLLFVFPTSTRVACLGLPGCRYSRAETTPVHRTVCVFSRPRALPARCMIHLKLHPPPLHRPSASSGDSSPTS